MRMRRLVPIFVLLALPMLVGSSCAFFFSSGGGSTKPDDKEEEEERIGVANSGRFGEPPIQGVNYVSGAIVGTTNSNGEFRYAAGEAVRFFIGEVSLGEPVPGKAVIVPQDLVPDTGADTAAAVNIARLLQSLDAQPGDERITIPASVRAAAVRSNPDVSSAIEFLDFADDPAFANAASQLVAVLTRDYPHTATLVDGVTAQQRTIKTP